ncbi:MAG TPA: hypothetical protein VLC92_18670 [Rhodocyclaceae bacterium]|nr:hypothetical protein [Rhodocyclaceae bacterium]
MANLSGSERGHLHPAKVLVEGGYVLLLDEPSNDLPLSRLRSAFLFLARALRNTPESTASS